MDILRNIGLYGFFLNVLVLSVSCNIQHSNMKENTITAADILGNPKYPAISYGGYRGKSRDIQPTVEELKEDLKILFAMGIRILRTYNVQLPHASNILKAIKTLKSEDPDFEMYVMLGAWIDCLNAWTPHVVNHYVESPHNADEIQRAIVLANEYPDIVKVLAVGNEAMVKWATSYYVQADVILKWVNHLQQLKQDGALPQSLWITSSDNFASWGGGDSEYHNASLEALVAAVDYISMHTYPFHDTHYNAGFWEADPEDVEGQSQLEQIQTAMLNARDYAIGQYTSVKDYVAGLGIEKPIHIGETGWATISGGFYGRKGSHAADEYKQALYYKFMRTWTNENNIACFFFEAFDEHWKDANNSKGSENHFGLFTVDGKAKYALWDLVDKGVFDGLTRTENPIVKTFKGSTENLFVSVIPPILLEPKLN